MKKLFTSAFFALAFLAASFTTATAGNDLKISAQATTIARELINELQLNESEYIKVKALTAEKLEKLAEIQKMYSNDAEMMASKIAEAESSYTHSIQSVLNSGQFEKYVAYMERNANAAVAATQE